MVSFVIPTFNGCHLLKKNLPALIKAAEFSKEKFEIIVVDDASTDETVAYLRKFFPQIKVLIHKDNKRFAVSCNDGVAAAEGEIVVLLNNDVMPEINFLRPLLENFKDKKVFAVGCKEKSRNKNKIIFSGRAEGEFKKGLLVHWRAQNQEKKTTLWAAGGSAAYRRDIWQKLGGLDSLYAPAYWEDIDISYRALKAGYKVLFEPKSVVFHQHETTNLKVFDIKEIKIISLRNQLIFVWKNITDYIFLINHFFWLPYHLVIGTLISRGIFLLAFFKAIILIPKIIQARNQVKKNFKLKDKEILVIKN